MFTFGGVYQIFNCFISIHFIPKKILYNCKDAVKDFLNDIFGDYKR
jgi:hypothetical protein